jgi:aldehyde:ferredoxin oxidoreductase
MNKHYGWAGTILKIDLTEGRIQRETLSKDLAYSYLGQRGINGKLLYDTIPPGTDAFHPNNPVIFGVGPLGGTLAPCSGRFTVTSKSPLTGIFGDANSGGHWGPELKQAGYDHIFITGQSSRPVYLWIDDDKVELRDASHIWGKTTWETEAAIQGELGSDKIQVLSIGPGGENLVRFAAIIANQARAAARTGIGAVMGSKNLKAVAVRGSRGVGVADPTAFAEAVAECEEAILHDPLYKYSSNIGTPVLTDMVQGLGALPTRNFQESTFEKAGDLSADLLYKNYVSGRRGCYNCPVGCSRFYHVKKGTYAGTVGEGPEYETIAAFGTKCGNSNLASILKANTLADQLGLDTISTGAVIGWALECAEKGILQELDVTWGDHQGILSLIEKIAYRQGIGNLLAEGTLKAAETLGSEAVDLVVHSKGMEYPATDVRAVKGMALGFAVASRGGDHLRSLPVYEVAPEPYKDAIREELGIEITPDYWLDYKTKPQLIVWHENWHAIVDSLSLCKLEGIAMKPLRPAHFTKLVRTATGWDISQEGLEKIGSRIIDTERLFNVQEGIRRLDDYPPKRILNEPISTGPSAGEKLNKNQFEKMLNEYYRLRGWDIKSGIPLMQQND